jgi:hypothetical protein
MLACAALLARRALSVDAWAQNAARSAAAAAGRAAGNPMCPRLEAQLATIDRGGSGDPAKDEQIRRYQEAATKQQGELDRVTSQAKRMGCDSSGFFSLFSGQSAQCGPVNNQIQQMRANLDQITTSLERLRSGGSAAPIAKTSAARCCGAGAEQLRPAICQRRARPGGSFLDNLFGNNNNPPPPRRRSRPAIRHLPHRLRAHLRRRLFPDLVRHRARRASPTTRRPARRFARRRKPRCSRYRNPGEDMNQAVSINGQPYSSLPNAFKLPQEFNPSCACKAAGQTWSDALKSVDDKAAAEQQGDIIVTEESAKKMRSRRHPRALIFALPRTLPPIRGPRARPAFVGLGQRFAGFAKAVGDGIAAVAAEILLRHLDAGRRLPPLVFGDVEQAIDPRTTRGRNPAATIEASGSSRSTSRSRIASSTS